MRHLVGARGFEPPTSSSRTMRATKLRHAPTEKSARCTGLGDDTKGRPAGQRSRCRESLRVPAGVCLGGEWTRRAPRPQRALVRIGSTDKAATPDAAAMIPNTIGSPCCEPVTLRTYV